MVVKSVINEVTRLENVYCEECPIKRDLRARNGKTAAHQFCISTCSVGKEIQLVGAKLLNSSTISN